MADLGFNIKLAGLGCNLSFKTGKNLNYAKRYFTNFISEDKPQMSIACSYEKLDQPIETANNIRHLGPPIIKFKNNRLSLQTSLSEGQFDFNNLKGRLTCNHPNSILNFLRLCYAFRLLMEKKAIILHSSGVLVKDKGVLFSGPPDAGKTTIMKLSGYPILNEEMNLLGLENGQAFVQSTPFGGDALVANIKKPLGKIFFIQQDKRTFVRDLSPLDIFSSLMQNELLSMNLLFNENREIVQELFNLINMISQKVEAKQLFFEKNKNFVKLLS